MKKQNLKYISFTKYFASSKEDKKTDRILDDIIKIIGAISGAVVIFTALLYIFGRNYAFGYFEAMNIPEYLLIFSLGEYGAVAWFPIIFLLIIGTVPTLILPIFDLLFSELIKRIIIILPKRKRRKKNFNKHVLKEKNESILYILYILFFLLISFLLYKGLLITVNIGKNAGKINLLHSSCVIELRTIEPTTINNGQVISSGNNTSEYYIYNGYRLITKNDGKYYLFKELDPETCKPKQVYIIDESSIDQVILSPAEDISDQCNDPVNP